MLYNNTVLCKLISRQPWAVFIELNIKREGLCWFDRQLDYFKVPNSDISFIRSSQTFIFERQKVMACYEMCGTTYQQLP